MGLFSWLRGKPGADILTAAALGGDAGAVRSAIAGGADVNAVGSAGTSPLILAIVQGHDEVARLLLEAGADVNLADRRGGMTALHAAAIFGKVELARDLIAGEADVDSTFGDPPMSALQVAFRKGHREVVRALLESCADPNVVISEPGGPPDQAGITPLHYAASTDDVAMIGLLASGGANLDALKADGLTPLMAAAFLGHLGAVRALVEAGAKVNLFHALEPGRMFAAVDLAALQGHDPVVQYLKGGGAIPTP